MIRGTTLFIGEKAVEMEYGNFVAKTYQSLVSSKLYVVALCYGNINSDKLYTRIHSSCVTSETLCGMDCDCVDQLNGALKRISEVGNGILFYLIQEGRGAGYVAKSRDRMIVQFSKDTITTFEAYKGMGLYNDLRDYNIIIDICYLMGISPEWVLLSNNMDKLDGMQRIGMNVVRMENLEYNPGPFNYYYLRSKQKYGHQLEKIDNFDFGFPLHKIPIEPFEPFVLEDNKRFIYCASYYLPIKSDKLLVMSREDYNRDRLKLGEHILEEERDVFFVELKQKVDFIRPYWFRVHMYYDVVSSNDYIILEYKEDYGSEVPVVRIHSESIFSRFPLKDVSYKQLYKNSVERIVRNGYGYIGLLYQDGKGHGLGAYVLDKVNRQMVDDARDYKGIGKLLKHHIDGNSIRLLVNGNNNIIDVCNKLDFVIEDVIDIGKDCLGHCLIEQRIRLAKVYYKDIEIIRNGNIDMKKKVIISGIGTSAVHGKFLEYLGKKNGYNFEYMTIDNVKDGKEKVLILFSQGLSPNAQILLDYDWDDIVLITSVASGDKLKLCHKAKIIYRFPLENEFGTLMRIVGPLVGFSVCINFMEDIGCKIFKDWKINWNYDEKEMDNVVRYMRKFRPQVKLVYDSSVMNRSGLENLQLKFLEGIFYESMLEICDILEFSHGYYQNLMYHNNNLLVLLGNNKDMDKIEEMVRGKSYVWRINGYGDMRDVIYCENIFNEFCLRLMRWWGVDQINWKGRDDENLLYQRSKKNI